MKTDTISQTQSVVSVYVSDSSISADTYCVLYVFGSSAFDGVDDMRSLERAPFEGLTPSG